MIDFKEKYKVWHGLKTLMEGGWRGLPVRVEGFTWSDYEELSPLLNKSIEESLIKYHYDINNIKGFSIWTNGDVLVQVKELTTKGNKKGE